MVADPTTEADNGYESGRMKTQPVGGAGGGGKPIMWNTLGLHAIYKCISSVAGLLSTNYPTEYRDILQTATRMPEPQSSGTASSLHACSITSDARWHYLILMVLVPIDRRHIFFTH
ncbi:unnamed protein product [Dibothriocephalus latus]|uniref:Uncharacterized protein n=1 Tax=Dibothriocephalus latus TaxID=60516 RepID=A0A3P6RNH4_DIBLA|nr:unnamed protein product [Dibothriocephalus latus]